MIFDRELNCGHMNSSYFWRQASISYNIYWNFISLHIFLWYENFCILTDTSFDINLLFFCLQSWNALLKASSLAFLLFLRIMAKQNLMDFCIPCVSKGLCSNHPKERYFLLRRLKATADSRQGILPKKERSITSFHQWAQILN